MRAGLVGLITGVVVSLCFVGGELPKRLYAQPTGSHGMPIGDDLVALPCEAADGHQILVLLDPQQRTLGSYSVDLRTGQVSLRCVRKFHYDLQMDEFNGTEPSAEQIKALLRSR